MKVYLGADHRGFEMKDHLVASLSNEGYEVVDLSSPSLDPGDDYPDIAERVARSVAGESDARGVLICGSGAGMNVAANKVRGARASIAFSPLQAQAARGDDDVNVLVLAANFISVPDAKDLINVFLRTAFKGEERHRRRLDKIADLENA